jgi:peptide chain release factor 2
MITSDQLKEVKDRTEQLHRYLNIDSKKIQLEEEQLRTQAPGFWDDQKKAEKDLQELTDKYTKKVDEACAVKEKELMEL